MRIGVDIDGVVSDSYPFWLGELNKFYGKDIQELHDYQMHLIFDVPWDDMNQFFIDHVEELFMSPLPMPGTKAALDSLRKDGHEIFLVTARREVEEDITIRWLTKYEIAYDRLLLVNDRNKAEVCSEQDIELFIEDYARNAELIAATGVKAIILDATYNRVEMSPEISRCYNWNQIIELIESIKKK